jgi:hypothetical protein
VVKRESKVTGCVSHVAVIISNNVEATPTESCLIEKWGVTTSRMMNSQQGWIIAWT